MSQRLADMAESTIATSSRSDRKLMKDAIGTFSEDLKAQLEQRIAQSSFQRQNQQALSEVSMPGAAGKGTREQAAARAWTGTEPLEDSALRMLDDSYKKLRTPGRRSAAPPPPVNLRPPAKKQVSAATRLANARDKTSMYVSQIESMSDKERDQLRKELKERFTPGARAMPTTLQGLASLANERIEDAIARGQFRNIQRGKGVNTERDYNANSPFLDTTEYFMNKIIQKQEIVPPWIEKQQELVKLSSSFRKRLRSDWRRHAARSIASQGGTLEEQVRRAKAYALAEEKANPLWTRPAEKVSSIDAAGNLTTITIEQRIAAGVAGEPEAGASPTSKPTAEQGTGPKEEIVVTVTENVSPPQQASGDSEPTLKTTSSNGSAPGQASETIGQTTQPLSDAADSSASPSTSTITASTSLAIPTSPPSQAVSPEPATILPMSHPFRDPSWERTELNYHTLAIAELNTLTRSYNLMAPKLAQKPYFTLQRELTKCFAEVAPQLADEIAERARRPAVKTLSAAQAGDADAQGVLDRLRGTGHVARVRDEDRTKAYGFRELWRDLFRRDGDRGPGTVQG